MHFHLITIFPEICRPYAEAGVLGRAQRADKGKGAKTRGKKITISYYNPRDYTRDKRRKVDDRPFGGGPGMVLKAEPILKAWDKAVGKKRAPKSVKTIILSPRGLPFTQTLARQYVRKYKHIVLISGRYEGIDARVKKALKAEEVSVGECVLSGGELPALIVIDAIARQVPGVLGARESLEEGRVAGGELYTRPSEFLYKKKRYCAPAVLRQGNHAAIEAWRAKRGRTVVSRKRL
jgi:tRNA (guanine37-N1)-methyltransferase